MKYAIKIISAVAFICSILWFYKVRDWEPLVATLAALVTLIGLFVTDKPSGHVDRQEIPAVETKPIDTESAKVLPVVAAQVGSLSGKVDIDIRRGTSYEIFYKRPFKRNPHLEIVRTHVLGNLEILEQRSDGFKVRSPDWDHIGIRWSAEGEFDE